MTVRVIFEGDTPDQIRQSVELLAAPAAKQIEWLRNMNFHADELGLLFFDAVPVTLPTLLAERKLTPDADRALRNLREALDALFGRDDAAALMADEALTSAPEWEEIRRLAALASATLTA